MEEIDLSQNTGAESVNFNGEQTTDASNTKKDSKKEKLVKAVVKDFMEFRKFDLIHKIYYLLLSREAVSKLSDSNNDKTEFKKFIDNYTKGTYVLIRNYLQKENLTKINEDIDNLAKHFMTSGQFASNLYFEDVLFSLRGYELLKLYLTTSFILPLIKKADSKALYSDIKTIKINSKTKSITTDFSDRQVALINNLINTSLDLSYSAYALKKSLITFKDYNHIDLELDYKTLATEQARTVPYPEEYDGDKDEEKMNKVYIKVDEDYKAYYKEKIHEVVEQFLQEEITVPRAMYFYVTMEIYLAYVTHLMKHDNYFVGIYIAMTIADECSRGFMKYLKPADFARVQSLKSYTSNLINKALTVLYSVGNFVDHHQLKETLAMFERDFAVAKEHYMGVTDLTVYYKAWYALVKFGKNGLDSFLHHKGKDKKEE